MLEVAIDLSPTQLLELQLLLVQQLLQQQQPRGQVHLLPQD